MMTPTIHSNGTSRQELLEGYLSAIAALNRAIDQVSLTAPDGRGYYVQDGIAYRQASNEHMNRIQRLNAVRQELIDIAENIT
jgi:hypothetical protein